jgi:hypothetical protein
MYSIMLYTMKTRVTFRVAEDLAATLRDLPNQTQFVEEALRAALREQCPACGGTGRKPEATVRVSNFRRRELPVIRRDVALQLRAIVALARRIAATDVELRAVGDALGFSIVRGSELLLRGTLSGAEARFGPS